jgi:hypothetical protein
MFRVMVLAAMACGCAGDPQCGHADETVYRCMPLLAGAKGCIGGPRSGDTRVFPVGCQVEVAACSELDPALPRTLECVVGAEGEPDWYEPI